MPFPPGVVLQTPGTPWPWPELASASFSPSYLHPCLLYIPPSPSCWPRARPSSGPGQFHLGYCPGFPGIHLPPQLLPAWQTDSPFCGANVILTSPGPNPTITSFEANLNSQARWTKLPEPGLAGPPAGSHTHPCSRLPSTPGFQGRPQSVCTCRASCWNTLPTTSHSSACPGPSHLCGPCGGFLGLSPNPRSLLPVPQRLCLVWTESPGRRGHSWGHTHHSALGLTVCEAALVCVITTREQGQENDTPVTVKNAEVYSGRPSN